MKLYHFCSVNHIQSILREGLTKGMVVVSIEKKLVISGYQWLTRNPDFNQSWSEHGTRMYDCTDFRITLKIPKRTIKQRVHKWNDYALHLVSKEMKDTLNEFGDPENWYLYQGFMPAKYIRSVAAKDRAVQESMEYALNLMGKREK